MSIDHTSYPCSVELLADRGRAMPQSLQADAERALSHAWNSPVPKSGTDAGPRSVPSYASALPHARHFPMPELAEWSVPDARNAAMSFSRRARVHGLRHGSALRSAYFKACRAAPHNIDAHYVARERGPCN